MPKATMKEEAQWPLDEDEPYLATLLSVEDSHHEGGISKRTQKEYSAFTTWKWKFSIADPNGGQDVWIYGDSEDQLTTHPDNKVRHWGEALRGAAYEIGEGIDTDDLCGLSCLMTLKQVTYTRANGEPGYKLEIENVFPADAAAPPDWA